MEISNQPDKEFKAIVIKMLIRVERRVDELSENFNKEIENSKEPVRAEKYSNCNKKYTRENQ